MARFLKIFSFVFIIFFLGSFFSILISSIFTFFFGSREDLGDRFSTILDGLKSLSKAISHRGQELVGLAFFFVLGGLFSLFFFLRLAFFFCFGGLFSLSFFLSQVCLVFFFRD